MSFPDSLFGLFVIFLNSKNKESKMYDAGFLLIWLGFFASICGILYGEMFGNTLPEFSPIVGFIGSPIHRVVFVLKISIGIGVIT